jgi:hypothetical protein
VGARLITTGQDAFPLLLGALDPPPTLIWTLGRAELTTKPGVAIVGARIVSAAGERFARDLAREGGAAGYPIVSGWRAALTPCSRPHPSRATNWPVSPTPPPRPSARPSSSWRWPAGRSCYRAD